MKLRGNAAFLLWIFLWVWLAGPFDVSAQSAGGKKITWQCTDEKLSEALRQIERQSEYYKVQFVYEDVEPYKVTVNLKQVTVEKALSEMLKGTSLRYEIEGRYVQVYALQHAVASGTIRGVVIDEHGEPLIGVTVRDKENNRGTVTDEHGVFTLPVPSSEHVTLTATYIGKKPVTKKVKNGQSIQIRMEDDSRVMQDVVVTGYQQLDRRNLTSSVVSVNMKDIEIPGVSSIDKMLEGRIPELMITTNSGEINATPRLRVRNVHAHR